MLTDQDTSEARNRPKGGFVLASEHVPKLPREVREGFVRFRHAVHVVFLLDCVALVLCGEHEFVGEFYRHRLSLASTGAVNEPAERECETACLRNFARHLVVCATNAARADFHERRDVTNCRIENLERVGAGRFHLFEGVVHNLARSVFLSVPHDGIDEPRERFRAVLEVRPPSAGFFKWASHKISLNLLRLLGSVARASLAALLEAGGVEFAAHDGVLDADILHAAAAKKHDGVLLEVVSFARDVGSHFHAVSKADAGDLTDSGVRFARGLGSHLGAHTTLKRRRIEGRAVLKVVKATTKSQDFRLAAFVLATLLRELLDGSHLEKEDPRWVGVTIYKCGHKCKQEVVAEPPASLCSFPLVLSGRFCVAHGRPVSPMISAAIRKRLSRIHHFSAGSIAYAAVPN